MANIEIQVTQDGYGVMITITPETWATLSLPRRGMILTVAEHALAHARATGR